MVINGSVNVSLASATLADVTESRKLAAILKCYGDGLKCSGTGPSKSESLNNILYQHRKLVTGQINKLIRNEKEGKVMCVPGAHTPTFIVNPKASHQADKGKTDDNKRPTRSHQEKVPNSEEH